MMFPEYARAIENRNKAIVTLVSKWKERSKIKEQREKTEIDLKKLEKENQQLHRKMHKATLSKGSLQGKSVGQEIRMMNIGFDFERVDSKHSSPSSSPKFESSDEDDDDPMDGSSGVESTVKSAGQKRNVLRDRLQQRGVASAPQRKIFAPKIVNYVLHPTPVKGTISRKSQRPRIVKKPRSVTAKKKNPPRQKQTPQEVIPEDDQPMAVNYVYAPEFLRTLVLRKPWC